MRNEFGRPFCWLCDRASARAEPSARSNAQEATHPLASWRLDFAPRATTDKPLTLAMQGRSPMDNLASA